MIRMIIDGATVPAGEDVSADICVVGAGPAGLTVARRMAGGSRRVVLIESGGEHPSAQSQELSDGDVVGHPYFALKDASARALGGSSYIWDQWMRARPLDEVDFAQREWVESSGWPISLSDLEPHYRKAHADLGLGEFDYGLAALGSEAESAEALESADIAGRVFRFSETGDFTTRRDEIERSQHVLVMLNSVGLELKPSQDGHRVERLLVAAHPGAEFSVTADLFVLACGGIENPRLLMLSRDVMEGLGESGAHVGRYFMEHPTLRRGQIVPAEGLDLEHFTQRTTSESTLRVAFSPTRELMRRERTLNAMVLLTPATRGEVSERRRSLSIVRRRVKGVESAESASAHARSLALHPIETLKALGRSDGEPVLRLSFTIEQAPRAESRVLLGERVDRYGRELANLQWRLGEQERHTVRTLQGALGDAFQRAGLGRLEGKLGEESPPRSFRGEWHHLGTTRMSSEPAKGVVDPELRVWGIQNLFVAGGSVFPTGGYANPTLTIVALSHRLADHLDRVLAGSSGSGPW